MPLKAIYEAPSLYSFPSNAFYATTNCLVYPETDKASLEDGYSKNVYYHCG